MESAIEREGSRLALVLLGGVNCYPEPDLPLGARETENMTVENAARTNRRWTATELRKLPANDRLPWYAQHFEMVEVNSTFYTVPDVRLVDEESLRDLQRYLQLASTTTIGEH